MAIPYFSIIIPTHQRGTLLQRAIASVQSGGFRDYEIIVVSDTADRETMVVAADMLGASDTFVKRTGQPGPALSRNMGLQLARGERVIFLDDDDTFLADYLASAYRACLANPGAITYATNFRVVEEDRSKVPLTPNSVSDYSIHGVAVESVYIKNFINCNALVYPAALAKNKRQDPHLDSLEDWDFLLSTLQDAELAPVDIAGPVTHKDYVNIGNRRGSSTSAQGLHVISDYLAIYKKWSAPSSALAQQRQDFMAVAGFRPPIEWL